MERRNIHNKTSYKILRLRTKINHILEALLLHVIEFNKDRKSHGLTSFVGAIEMSESAWQKKSEALIKLSALKNIFAPLFTAIYLCLVYQAALFLSPGKIG